MFEMMEGSLLRPASTPGQGRVRRIQIQAMAAVDTPSPLGLHMHAAVMCTRIAGAYGRPC